VRCIPPQAIAASPRCERFSGADLAGLAREAAVVALKEHLFASGDAGLVAAETSEQADLAAPLRIDEGPHADTTDHSKSGVHTVAVIPPLPAPSAVHQRHLRIALERMVPSVSLADERMYNALRGRMRQARSHLVSLDPESLTNAVSAETQGRIAPAADAPVESATGPASLG
jgi:ribosome biogenesis ATPase